MWKENKTSTIEGTKELIPWVNIKEEREIFDAKIMASNELSDEQKKTFINILSQIPDNEFREKYEYLTKNYWEVIKWLKLIWSFDKFIKALDGINESLIELKIRSWQLIREKQDKLTQIEKLSAENSMNNFIA